MQLEGYKVDDQTKCQLFEEALVQKLFIDQSKLDSIHVTVAQIDDEIEKRVKNLTEQIGTLQKLEEYYGKKLSDIKKEWKPMVEEQLLAHQVQTKILSDVQISPNEVRIFYSNLPPDSIPTVNPEYEIAQIVVKPPIEPKQKIAVKDELDGLRARILKGESFAKLAVMYSEDLSSAKKGGELGYLTRSDLVPEFASVAFKLKPGEISRIVETQYGYHIIELIDKKGEKVNVRHILMSPKISKDNIMKAKLRIDSVSEILSKDTTVTFGSIALKYSDDESTRNNGGLYQNPYTGTSKFDAKQIEPSLLYALKELKASEISKPILTQDETAKQVYKIVKLVKKTESHKATLLEDYQLIKEMALSEKKHKMLDQWIKTKQAKTYISIDTDFAKCNFKHQGWIK
jgi:peptidyl-prolyl cis-trans isomerase SurA